MLENFSWPVFPLDEKFSALNVELLASAGPVQGGAPFAARAPAVFKLLPPLGAATPRKAAARGGEPFLPVEFSPDGTAARVDMAPAAATFDELRRELAAARAEGKSLRNTVAQLKAAKSAKQTRQGATTNAAPNNRRAVTRRRAFGGDGAAAADSDEESA